MGLQKFKLQIANTVISQDNASLESMGIDHLLDLFRLDEKNKNNDESKLSVTRSSSSSSGQSKTTMKAVLEGLPEIWDTDQYDREYDLSDFIQTLN